MAVMTGKNSPQTNDQPPGAIKDKLGKRLALVVRATDERGDDAIVAECAGTLVWQKPKILLELGEGQKRLEIKSTWLERIEDVPKERREALRGCDYQLSLTPDIAKTMGRRLMPRLKVLEKWVKENRLTRIFALVLCLISIPLSLAVVWYAWDVLLTGVWGWGFVEPSAVGKHVVVRLFVTALVYMVAAFGVLMLAVLPLYAPVGAVFATFAILALHAEAQTAELGEMVDRDSRDQAQVEDELKAELKDLKDTSGLVSMVRYSRIQLKPYYKIGITQTQRSFRYSVIAMWIGFAVILAGIGIWFIDPGTLKKFGLHSPDPNVTHLVVLSGAVIEVISALFLWVYRSSIRQLNYFYNRQMYNHSVLMCHRITATMQASSSDDVKKAIIDKILDKTWALEQEVLPTGKPLLSFGSQKPNTSA